MMAMLEMVTMKSKGQKTLSPIHLISLVDPKAKWLKAWIHGNLGRQLFFNLGDDHVISTGHQTTNLVSNFEHLLLLCFLMSFEILGTLKVLKGALIQKR